MDLNNVIRSAAIVVVGLPLTGAIGVATVSLLPEGPTEAERVEQRMKGELTEACLKWAVSRVDSKLEREAKNEIDDYFGGEVSHKDVCNYVL